MNLRVAFCRAGLKACATVFSLLVAAVAIAGAAEAGQTRDAVTFTRDIAPLLQRSCQQCHRPDSVAPMSLITYEEVRPYARAIKQRTGLRSKPGAMPPWYIEKNVGIQKYKDDISLSDEEVAKIAAWADGGAPRGNPADMPPPVVFADANAWHIGMPDLIVESPEITMKAVAPDWFGAIGEVATNLPEERYVSAVEIKEINDLRGKPSTRTTVGGLYLFHHAAIAVLSQDNRGNGIGGWPVHEVGRNAEIFDADAGRLMPANARVLFPSVHAHANGTDAKARLQVGFKFHPKGYKPTLNLQPLFVGNGPDIDIRGMEANQRQDVYFTLPQNTKIVTYEPHMHAPGVRMCLEAIWGISVQTLTCSGYNHSWVRVYNYADDAAPLLPKGTILHVIGYFDNSPANKNVVDPRNWSGSGHRSVDNMVINLMQSIALTDDQFQAEMAKRRATLNLRDGQSVIGCPLCSAAPAPARTAGQQN
jgi:mono/diheme cytochrome c family protein